MTPVPAGRAEHDLAGAMTTANVVMQRTAFAQRHADQAALGRLGRLADCLGNLAGLAVAVADAALLVADDDEGSKGHAAAALHGLGNAVDVDEAVNELVVALLAVFAAAATALTWLFRHSVSPDLRGTETRSLS